MIGPFELLVVLLALVMFCVFVGQLYRAASGGTGNGVGHNGDPSWHNSMHTTDAAGTVMSDESAHTQSRRGQDAAHTAASVPDSAVTFDVGWGAGGDGGGWSGGFDGGGGGCDGGGGGGCGGGGN